MEFLYSKTTTLLAFSITLCIFGTLLNVKPAYPLPADDVRPLIDEEYYPALHNALTGAGKSVLCVMYMAKLDPKHQGGDEYQLIMDLISAHKRGVKVLVIFDQNVKFWEKGTKHNVLERKSKYAYKLLSEGGVPVYYDNERKVTHSKIIIIDHYITILGSTNWTYGALRKNHEASVMIKSKSVAFDFEKKLKRIDKNR